MHSELKKMEKSCPFFQLNKHHEYYTPNVPEVKHEYKKVQKIGRGTYGCVFKAVAINNPSRFVALKKIDITKEKEGFPVTALREITLLQSLNNENVLRLLQIVVSKKSEMNDFRRSTFLVFDYMEHDLYGLIQKIYRDLKKQFYVSHIKLIMYQMLKGIEYLHNESIWHRDIKSANILLDNKGVLKIADFGLAKRNKPNQSSLTRTVVTLWYRPPEVLFGHLYNEKIDIWSIGCIFAELLTGDVLFQGENERELCKLLSEKMGHPGKYWPNYNHEQMKSSRTREFDPILEAYRESTCCLEKYIKRPDLPESGMDLLKKLLTYDPKMRLTASQALAHDFFKSEPVMATREELSSYVQNYVTECHDMTYRDEKRKM